MRLRGWNDRRSLFVWVRTAVRANVLEKFAKTKSNETTDKNIWKTLNCTMLQLSWGSERTTRTRRRSFSKTRYDILARASQFYCRAFTVVFVAICAISAHLSQLKMFSRAIPARTTLKVRFIAMTYRIKLMLGTATRCEDCEHWRLEYPLDKITRFPYRWV